MTSSVVVKFFAIFLLICCLNGNLARNAGNSEGAVDFLNQIVSEVKSICATKWILIVQC